MRKENYNIVVTSKKIYYDKKCKNLFLKKSLFDSINQKSKKNNLINDYNITNSYVKKNILFLKKKKSIYEKQLIKILNNYHNVHFNEKYWSIILDSWLVHVISSIKIRLDELSNLTKIKNKNNLSITENNKEYFFDNTSQLVSNIVVDDHFNQNFYSKIAKHLNISTTNNRKMPEGIVEVKSSKNRLFYVVKNLIYLYIHIFSPTLLIDSYFKNPFKYLVFSYGKVLILPSNILFSDSTVALDLPFRKKIRIKERDYFDKIFNKFLKNFLPKSFLENYTFIKKDIDPIAKAAHKIGTAIGIHNSDHYKILGAELSTKKKKYLGFQHGGYYNCQTSSLVEDVEKRNSSKYYYWNNKKGLGLNYLPSFQKVSQKQLRKNEKIILYMSFQKYYNVRFKYQMDYGDNYNNINQYFKFYDNLSETLKNYFVVKAVPSKTWWNSPKFWEDKYKGKVSVIKKTKSRQVLKIAKLFVSSQISTAFIEALYSGIPIIMFTNLEEYSYKPNVKKLFNNLQNIGVIHRDPVRCAKFINNKYENLIEWWNDVKIQKEIKKIRNELFTEKKNYFTEIINELRK